MSNKILVLDPGHGGKDPGAVGNGLREKDLNLDISKRIKAYIEKVYTGVTVKLTRSTDVFIELGERANISDRLKADYFCSIHINAGGGSGWESYIYNGGVSQTTKNAQKTVNAHVMAVIKKYGSKSHGADARSANFAVVRETHAPALLTENLFIDSSADANLLKRSDFLQDLAEAHGEGFADVLNLSKKTAPAPAPAKPAPATGGKDTHRVFINGKQIGAYSDDANVLNEVAKFLKSKDKKLTIEEV